MVSNQCSYCNLAKHHETRCTPRLHVSIVLLPLSIAAMLSESSRVAIAVACTRPRAIPLTMIAMSKLIHGLPLLPYMGMVLRYQIFLD